VLACNRVACVSVAVATDAAGNPRGTGFARFINRKHGEAAIMGLHGKVCVGVESAFPLDFLPFLVSVAGDTCALCDACALSAPVF
jgi:hypothetical protein